MSLGIVEVGKDSLRHVLTRMGPGHSVVIILGGAPELLEVGQRDTYHLTLKNRKGFARLALETGYVSHTFLTTPIVTPLDHSLVGLT